MGILESLNDFFINVLPEKINTTINFLVYELGSYAWIVFILVITVGTYFLIIFSRKIIQYKNKEDKQNRFLDELSGIKKSMDIEQRIFKFAFSTLQCKYSALYELRGETYISLASSVPSNKDNEGVGLSLRISKQKLSSLNSSGNYKAFKIISSNEKYLLLLYSSKTSNIDSFYATLKLALGYYEAVINKEDTTSDKQLAKINEETMQAIVKAQFGKEGYLKFLIAIILKIFDAKGGRISTNDKDEVYEVGTFDCELKKVFYIRNTPYKFDFYRSEDLVIDEIKEIGSFLDMSGAFLVSLSEQSTINKNYISFLKNANSIMETTTPYYKNHSEKVKIVAVEVAKNLFMDEERLDAIILAAELHDIGMLGDMELIINSESKLEKKDIDLMHYHPVIGSILLEPIAHLYPITNIVKQHHERFDGRGYPNKLKGSEISLDSQSLALAEHFVGIISDRSYKKGMDFDDAVKEIDKVSSKMFDPNVVKAFIEAKDKIKTRITRLENLTDENKGKSINEE